MQKTKYSRKNNFSLGKQNGWSQKLVDPDVRKIFWDKCFMLKKILNNFILHIMNNFMTVMCKMCFSTTHQILFRKLPIKYECFMMIYLLFVLLSFLLSYQFHYWYTDIFLLSNVSMLPSKHSPVQSQQKKTR